MTGLDSEHFFLPTTDYSGQSSQVQKASVVGRLVDCKIAQSLVCLDNTKA